MSHNPQKLDILCQVNEPETLHRFRITFSSFDHISSFYFFAVDALAALDAFNKSPIMPNASIKNCNFKLLSVAYDPERFLLAPECVSVTPHSSPIFGTALMLDKRL